MSSKWFRDDEGNVWVRYPVQRFDLINGLEIRPATPDEIAALDIPPSYFRGCEGKVWAESGPNKFEEVDVDGLVSQAVAAERAAFRHELGKRAVCASSKNRERTLLDMINWLDRRAGGEADIKDCLISAEGEHTTPAPGCELLWYFTIGMLSGYGEFANMHPGDVAKEVMRRFESSGLPKPKSAPEIDTKQANVDGVDIGAVRDTLSEIHMQATRCHRGGCAQDLLLTDLEIIDNLAQSIFRHIDNAQPSPTTDLRTRAQHELLEQVIAEVEWLQETYGPLTAWAELISYTNRLRDKLGEEPALCASQPSCVACPDAGVCEHLQEISETPATEPVSNCHQSDEDDDVIASAWTALTTLRGNCEDRSAFGKCFDDIRAALQIARRGRG